MYAHALAYLVTNIDRLTPRHAALVRMWQGIAEAQGLTAGQAKAVVTVWERFTGEQGEYSPTIELSGTYTAAELQKILDMIRQQENK